MTKLTTIAGGGETTSGKDVLRLIGELLAEHLPAVPHDDPYWLSLVRLARAAGRPDATSPVRSL